MTAASGRKAYLEEWFDPEFEVTEERYLVGESGGGYFIEDSEGVLGRKSFHDLSALISFVRQECDGEGDLGEALI